MKICFDLLQVNNYINSLNFRFKKKTVWQYLLHACYLLSSLLINGTFIGEN